MNGAWNVSAWLVAAAESDEPPTDEDRRRVKEMMQTVAMRRVAGRMLKLSRDRAVASLMALDPADQLAVKEAQHLLRVVQLAFETLAEVVND